MPLLHKKQPADGVGIATGLVAADANRLRDASASIDVPAGRASRPTSAIFDSARASFKLPRTASIRQSVRRVFSRSSKPATSTNDRVQSSSGVDPSHRHSIGASLPGILPSVSDDSALVADLPSPAPPTEPPLQPLRSNAPVPPYMMRTASPKIPLPPPPPPSNYPSYLRHFLMSYDPDEPEDTDEAEGPVLSLTARRQRRLAERLSLVRRADDGELLSNVHSPLFDALQGRGADVQTTVRNEAQAADALAHPPDLPAFAPHEAKSADDAAPLVKAPADSSTQKRRSKSEENLRSMHDQLLSHHTRVEDIENWRKESAANMDTSKVSLSKTRIGLREDDNSLADNSIESQLADLGRRISKLEAFKTTSGKKIKRLNARANHNTVVMSLDANRTSPENLLDASKRLGESDAADDLEPSDEGSPARSAYSDRAELFYQSLKFEKERRLELEGKVQLLQEAISDMQIQLSETRERQSHHIFPARSQVDPGHDLTTGTLAFDGSGTGVSNIPTTSMADEPWRTHLNEHRRSMPPVAVDGGMF